MPFEPFLEVIGHSTPLISHAQPTHAARKHRIVIQGVTRRGRAFRPSDWAERLCGIMSTFGGDQQMRYSPHVRPLMLDGVRCVIVDPSLAALEPRAYRFLFDFAGDNESVVIDPLAAISDDFCPVPGRALETLSSC